MAKKDEMKLSEKIYIRNQEQLVCPYCWKDFGITKLVCRRGTGPRDRVEENLKSSLEQQSIDAELQPVSDEMSFPSPFSVPEFDGLRDANSGTPTPSSDPKLRNDFEELTVDVEYGIPTQFLPDCTLPDREPLRCPHCKNKIPWGYLENQPYFISLIGVTASGKSHMLVAMTDKFAKNSQRTYSILFRPVEDKGTKGDDVNKKLNDRQCELNRAADNRAPIPATSPVDISNYVIIDNDEEGQVKYPRPYLFTLGNKEDEHPVWNLIHHVKIPGLVNSDINKKVSLCFNDIAGELYTLIEGYEGTEVKKQFQRRGNVHLILYDPGRNRYIVDLYNKNLMGTDLDERELISRSSGNSGIFNTISDWISPVVVMVLVTKFDEYKGLFVKYLREKSYDELKFRRLFQYSSHGVKVERDDLVEISNQLKDFLNPNSTEHDADQDFFNQINVMQERRGSEILFLPVSAMGCPSVANGFEVYRPIWTEIVLEYVWEQIRQRANI